MALKKTELYVENRQIDLYGDEAFVLNFNIAEINDISAKASAYSKELDIPASKQNNQTFSHLFDVNSEGYFNPLAKKTAQIYVDGVCVMQGFFKLNSITITDAEYVTYHGVIYEDSINFLQSLGDLELTNLVLPLTGSTTTSTGTGGTIVIDQLTGTDYTFKAATGGSNPAPANRVYNANYNNALQTGGLWGSLQPIDKNIPNAPWGSVTGVQHSSTTISAFVALQAIKVKLTPAIYLQVARSVSWQWYIVKPSGGTYIHTPIAGFGVNNSGGNLISFIGTPTNFGLSYITLQAGWGIYLLINDSYPINHNGSIPPPPISFTQTSKINGLVIPVNVTTVNNLLIDENFVLNNMNTVSSSLTGSICFPILTITKPFHILLVIKALVQLVKAKSQLLGLGLKIYDQHRLLNQYGMLSLNKLGLNISPNFWTVMLTYLENWL